MNYRHQFHAGNFADVVKHVLLGQLMRALQRKDKGFLYLDTHAGRGRYDLATAATGDSLARAPEWPEGIGRLWGRRDLPAPLVDYVELVRGFDRQAGNLEPGPRFYPGSPWVARLLARSVDRLALCEKHPAECAALAAEFGRVARVSVHEMDGYEALRAMLPPPERRALVLIDPPFEEQNEFAQMVAALGQGLRRLPAGVFVLWYPLTGRARLGEFFAALGEVSLPPTLRLELAIAGEESVLTMKGCGLVIVNPPWGFEAEAAPVLSWLAEALGQSPGGVGRTEWVVPEN